MASWRVLALTDPPCPVPVLAAGELHLWLAELDLATGPLEQLLSADERERASRFRFQRDRHHYTVARALLRTLLSHYTNDRAESFQFTYNAHGKPALPNDHPCRFNVGHSHGWAIYGFAIEQDVGVDIERIRPDFAGLEIARRFFSPTEVAALRRVPEVHRTKAFFDCWTRKEAFIKAKGLGVFLGLHTFAVTLAPGEKAALISHNDDADAHNRWRLFELESPAGYVGAAAVEAKDVTARYWKWNPSLFQKL